MKYQGFMNTPWSFLGLAGASLALISMPLHAQTEHNHAQHSSQESPTASKTIQETTGDPYTLTTCPVSGQALGSMGESVIYTYQGREIRFCCAVCISKFEADPGKFIQKIDQLMIQDQLPVYPLGTCVVSGEKLGGSMGKPVDFIYKNRLVRFCCPSCVELFKNNPDTFLKKLDDAVVEKQRSSYPLTTCPVSGEKLGGSMGKPVDKVVANRLVRLCCPACETALAKDPQKVLGKVYGTSAPKPNVHGSHKQKVGHNPAGYRH